MSQLTATAGASAAVVLLALARSSAYPQSKKWYPFLVEEHIQPFEMNGPVKEVMYDPLSAAPRLV